MPPFWRYTVLHTGVCGIIRQSKCKVFEYTWLENLQICAAVKTQNQPKFYFICLRCILVILEKEMTILM